MANFVVLHLEKAKGADAKMSAHIERTFIAANVDESRIHLDRELIAFPESVKSRSAAIEHRIKNANLKRKVGKNQVHAIRVMLSASPEAMERIEQEGRLDNWCEQSVEWMQETFGKENLVSAVLHLDEKTPHIHATIVPIVTATRRKKKSEENVKKHYRKKAEGARLCADDLMTQAKLKNYQTSYANAMQPFGLERGIDGSEARHISTREYYTEQYRKAENLKEDISLLAEQKEKVAEDLSKAKSELKQTTLKKDISNASSNVARAIGSLFTSKDQQVIADLNKQLFEKDRVITTLKNTIREREAVIETERGNVESAEKELEQFRRDIEKWYPGICINVAFANRCSCSYRISDEVVKQLLGGKSVLCSGKFRPMGEKVPFELDNAVFSSKTVKQGYRDLFINGVSVDDMIKNRRNQWYLDRKQREAIERLQRTSRGRRM
ncbi:mobilization protein [Parabacteroides sp. AF17-28]|uniref:MobV family relaxase n=1 Tax=Parabacteroides sp. AF17-28 TaxID=2292241 RepID=UPI000F0052C7|nr:MobV family relaxase [Parabacteroides sp. AF17-28]RHR55625.1 mobilization protein [Parabacteroides sp. AF17-28]